MGSSSQVLVSRSFTSRIFALIRLKPIRVMTIFALWAILFHYNKSTPSRADGTNLDTPHTASK
jgi:hypothetical protein